MPWPRRSGKYSWGALYDWVCAMYSLLSGLAVIMHTLTKSTVHDGLIYEQFLSLASSVL